MENSFYLVYVLCFYDQNSRFSFLSHGVGFQATGGTWRLKRALFNMGGALNTGNDGHTLNVWQPRLRQLVSVHEVAVVERLVELTASKPKTQKVYTF